MNQNIVSAVFDSHSEAETAVRALREAGVRDSALSVIARREGADGDYGDANTQEVGENTEGLIKGALGGAGVGALLGIAALAIPGVGPLVAAGAIATSAIPGAAALFCTPAHGGRARLTPATPVGRTADVWHDEA